MTVPEPNYGYRTRQLLEEARRIANNFPAAIYNARTIVDVLIPEFNRLERIERALESIGVNLDEEDIQALEWIAEEYGTTHSERSWFRDHANKLIREASSDMRHTEQKEAIDALTSAGFVLNDEDGETWTRTSSSTREIAKIELANGAESRYKWEYERGPVDDFPADDSLDSIICASGKSGEFDRLIELIGRKVSQ